MERSHEEIEELLGAYALDAVDADEAAAVESHLRHCPRCAAEVADHREVAAMMAYSGGAAPDGVWDRIVETLEEPPPAMNLSIGPPSSASSSAPVVDLAGWRDRRTWFPLGAVAAALLVIGLIGGVLVGQDRGDEPQAEQALTLEELYRQTLNDDSSSRVALESEDGELTATAALASDGSGYLAGTSLPALDDSQTYQLWGVRDGAVVSLGVLGNAPGVVAFHLDDSIAALAITAEVAGGVVSSQNDAVVEGAVS